MDYKTVNKFLLSFSDARLDYPFGEGVATYKVEDKIFAIVAQDKSPIQISLRGDPRLNELLRSKYETVLPGYNLNKKQWNTILLTGQLPWEEIQGFIRHSYDLVLGSSA